MNTKLTFSHYAWTKLLYMRDKGSTEIACYGIGSEEDPLFIEDVRLMEQECTSTFAEMDGAALADLLDEMAAKNIPPNRCCRVWIHTHPGNSASPSMVDENTFKDVYGSCPWAVMAIVARGGDQYARLRLKVDGQDYEFPIAMTVKQAVYTQQKAWDAEYTKNVKEKKWTPIVRKYDDDDYGWGRWGKLDDGSYGYRGNGYQRTTDPQDDFVDKDSTEDERLDIELVCLDCRTKWTVDSLDAKTVDKCPNSECQSESIDFVEDEEEEKRWEDLSAEEVT